MKRKLLDIFGLTTVILMFSSYSYSQSIDGDWHGAGEIQGITLRLSLHVEASGDRYTLTWDSPDQGVFGMPATTTTFKYPDFSFTNAGMGLKYTGTVNSSYNRITGNIEQNGAIINVSFGRTPVEASGFSQQSLKKIYDKKEIYITMRDGVRLFTSIYTPKNISVKHPILLNRTPYNIEPGGPDEYRYSLLAYSRYLEEEYIMVFQDVRGRYMSEGDFEDIRPYIPDKKGNKDTDESSDTWDTVDWLIKNVANNNGNVGIYGISYPGFYSTMGIIDAHPAVKAVSPQAPVTAWFIGDDFHHNGAFFMLDCFSFYYSFGRIFRQPSRNGFPRFRYPTPDNYEFFMSVGPVKNLSAKYLGDSIKFWNDAFSHPNYDEFWKARDPRQYLTNVKPAVMTVGGWFDAEDLYGALHVYSAIESQNSQSVKNTIVMGPWSHGQWASGGARNLGNIYWGMDANKKYIELEEQFFNQYLKENESLSVPEAMMFITGSNEWRTFKTWPPQNIAEKSLYLGASGKLDFSSSTLKESYDEYVSDPMKPVPYTEDVHLNRTREYMTDDQRFASRRPDVMVYQTDVLSEDITLTGPLSADLFVSTSGTDADYVVKLIDVFPPDTKQPQNEDIKVPLGGYQMLVRGDVFRGRFRNSFEKPEPFAPGRVTEVKFDLPDIAHTFKKGHRIMIQIQNSWFPLVDRNPQKYVDIYKCSEDDFQKATQRIYHDSRYQSNLKVRVLQ